MGISLRSPVLLQHDAGHQVGKGLADAGPCVAQSNTAVQHGVQHTVAQPDLLRALSHAVLGKQFPENTLDLIMGLLFGK